jgi:hypothetical protein
MAVQKERRAAPRKPASASPEPKPRKPAAAAALSNEELYRLIQEAAYFKAKARGFAPGREAQDWIEAEVEVRQRVGGALAAHSRSQ